MKKKGISCLKRWLKMNGDPREITEAKCLVCGGGLVSLMDGDPRKKEQQHQYACLACGTTYSSLPPISHETLRKLNSLSDKKHTLED